MQTIFNASLHLNRFCLLIAVCYVNVSAVFAVFIGMHLWYIKGYTGHNTQHKVTKEKVIRLLCHITEPCVPPVIYKGQNTATCLFLIGREGRLHHSPGMICLLLPCLF